jgi:hypothetical protein
MLSDAPAGIRTRDLSVKGLLYPLSYEGNRLPREASRDYSRTATVLAKRRLIYPCKPDT